MTFLLFVAAAYDAHRRLLGQVDGGDAGVALALLVGLHDGVGAACRDVEVLVFLAENTRIFLDTLGSIWGLAVGFLKNFCEKFGEGFRKTLTRPYPLATPRGSGVRGQREEAWAGPWPPLPLPLPLPRWSLALLSLRPQGGPRCTGLPVEPGGEKGLEQ
eukprot:scaffold86886_cov27-Tisochrysis_lutea.AAC.1